MKRKLIQLVTFTLLAGAMTFAPARVQAQDETTNAPAAAPRPKLPHFRGTVSAIDANAKTVTVGKFTYEITSATKIFKNHQPATLEDGAVGDMARGSYKHDGDKRIALRIAFSEAAPSGGTPPPAGSQ